ncbi:DUF2268 domain-containing protein [Bacillus haynesii]|uniref:DUF2268 domain-containing protein n=1 Tax=Bacillus haynesii TaxID=1925021 RepID=UPI0015934B15|nr:DUF2268 domain-containing protein [Bacillus haynesii]NVB33896.1 DUF2268 domain-containing protein [Bacillus licheniformis]MCY7777722.1 DUF2268 domain-containing protein [Bacillus haynesii]MEC0670995.1 DUF2268 domain-containing protein [Bacillus haynesii]MEC1418983.1 DUF2268 domain-containing protein [Bacillus haynesii]MEC1468537.1 DUF2268 domain-containing protein [Bacillus haynesii]
MSIASTYEWLEQASSVQELSSFLTPYFKGASKADAAAIVSHLQTHGMFRSWTDGEHTMKQLKKNGVFQHVRREEQLLCKRWNGPDVPIFILPVDERNRRIRVEFGSKSGLAFSDKLFLFLSADLPRSSISAIMTHEYNHVCRLENMPKEENKMTLLDTIILEGIAEYAVFERLGEAETTAWTSYYTEKQLRHFQDRFVKPHFELRRHEGRLFSNILFGKGHYPDMLGYAVGYSIVKKHLSARNLKVADVLAFPSEDFIKLSL